MYLPYKVVSSNLPIQSHCTTNFQPDSWTLTIDNLFLVEKIHKIMSKMLITRQNSKEYGNDLEFIIYMHSWYNMSTGGVLAHICVLLGLMFLGITVPPLLTHNTALSCWSNSSPGTVNFLESAGFSACLHCHCPSPHFSPGLLPLATLPPILVHPSKPIPRTAAREIEQRQITSPPPLANPLG